MNKPGETTLYEFGIQVDTINQFVEDRSRLHKLGSSNFLGTELVAMQLGHLNSKPLELFLISVNQNFLIKTFFLSSITSDI